MQRWEYLVIEVIRHNSLWPVARSVNGQQLRDLDKTPLHIFLAQLGADGWEMTGTMALHTEDRYLFFKRPLS